MPQGENQLIGLLWELQNFVNQLKLFFPRPSGFTSEWQGIEIAGNRQFLSRGFVNRITCCGLISECLSNNATLKEKSEKERKK